MREGSKWKLTSEGSKNKNKTCIGCLYYQLTSGGSKCSHSNKNTKRKGNRGSKCRDRSRYGLNSFFFLYIQGNK